MDVPFFIWVSSSLAGAGAGMPTTLAALTLAAFVALAIFLVTSYDTYEREEQALLIWNNIKEKYGSVLDPARGLLIVTCTPLVLCYILVSTVNQFCRNINVWYQRPPNDTESLRNVAGVSLIIMEARRLVQILGSWDRAKVFTYAIYWGIAIMIMSVIVAKFTIVFLSWLIEYTSGMDLAVVT